MAGSCLRLHGLYGTPLYFVARGEQQVLKPTFGLSKAKAIWCCWSDILLVLHRQQVGHLSEEAALCAAAYERYDGFHS